MSRDADRIEKRFNHERKKSGSLPGNLLGCGSWAPGSIDREDVFSDLFYGSVEPGWRFEKMGSRANFVKERLTTV